MTKISRQPIPRSERGAAMLAALCLAMVFAIALSSYLALCYTSLAMSTRNVVTDHCLELAESGLEQALYASNGNALGVSSALTGWTVTSGATVTTVSTTMTMTSSGLLPTSGAPTPLNFGNGATGLANLTFTYLNGQPMAIQTITSQGVIALPTGTIVSNATPTVSRTLSYTAPVTSSTSVAPLFVNAVAATTGNVKFSAAGTLDSYNSGSALPYVAYVAANAGYSAVVASADVASGTATVRLKDAVVHGYAVGYDAFSPSTDNWLSYAGGGKLVGATTPMATSIDSSRILTTPVPYQPVFPENLPSTASTLPVGASSGGNILNLTTTLGNAGSAIPLNYYASGISLGNGKTVTIVGPVVLIVNGAGFGNAVSITGTGGIVLTTKQASLTIFCNGGNLALGGTGITNTNTVGSTLCAPLAKRVALLSTTASGYTVTMSETQPFYGVVYFPNEAITISSASTITGSIVGSTVTISSSPTIHYDVALRTPDSSPRDAAFEYVTAPITVNSLVASVP
jgi:hypothetical protein